MEFLPNRRSNEQWQPQYLATSCALWRAIICDAVISLLFDGGSDDQNNEDEDCNRNEILDIGKRYVGYHGIFVKKKLQ